MYKILEKQILSDAIVLMVVETPHMARNAKPHIGSNTLVATSLE